MARKPLAYFSLFKHDAAGGAVLLVAAIAALIIANSPLATPYHSALAQTITLGIPPLALSKTVLHWINDGLMAIFFFLVGLEIKRELLVGALADRKSAAMPAIAAVGGMIVPAVIYAAINWQNPIALHGWAIPAATDIAFAVGIMAALGSRVPPALKVFLLALAILDDLGAILIIALFYTSQLSLTALLFAAAGVSALWVLNGSRVTRIWPYLLVGVFVWVCVLKSGVHATLAGVATALAIPLAAGHAGRAGPLEILEHRLAPWVSFLILPLFALANAGVSLSGIQSSDLLKTVPLGIILGLVIGKPAGIYAASVFAIKTNLGAMPRDTTRMQLLGAGALGGIGFTMSLFIGMLAFPDPALATDLRLGVLAGSLVSAIAGYLILSRAGPAEPPSAGGSRARARRARS